MLITSLQSSFFFSRKRLTFIFFFSFLSDFFLSVEVAEARRFQNENCNLLYCNMPLVDDSVDGSYCKTKTQPTDCSNEKKDNGGMQLLKITWTQHKMQNTSTK